MVSASSLSEGALAKYAKFSFAVKRPNGRFNSSTDPGGGVDGA
jgi:hypothetical protein